MEAETHACIAEKDEGIRRAVVVTEGDEMTRREVTLTVEGKSKNVIVEEFRDRNGFYASEILESNHVKNLTLGNAIKAIDDSLKDVRRKLQPS